MSSFTYEPSTDRGRVRLILADTRKKTAHFDDDEIDAALSTQGSVEGACYELAVGMVAHVARHGSSRTESGQGKSRSIDDTKAGDFWQAIADRYAPYATTARLPSITVISSRTPSADGWTE